MNYTLDTAAAKAANAGGRIDATGKYRGKIKHAIMFTNRNGTDAVEFEFTDSTGAASTLTLWTRNEKNPKLSGFNVLMSMMTVCAIKSLNGVNRVVKKYDYERKETVDTTVLVAPEFDGKEITLLLQREEYEKNDGGIGYRMNIFAAAQHSTDLTANEILERKTQPEELFKLMERLADKKAKPKAGGSKPAQYAPIEDLDDGIPF